jgi:hypothetical protein
MHFRFPAPNFSTQMTCLRSVQQREMRPSIPLESSGSGNKCNENDRREEHSLAGRVMWTATTSYVPYLLSDLDCSRSSCQAHILHSTNKGAYFACRRVRYGEETSNRGAVNYPWRALNYGRRVFWSSYLFTILHYVLLFCVVKVVYIITPGRIRLLVWWR